MDLGSFCRRHMKDEEELLLPKINESFDLPWFGGVMGKFGPWYGERVLIPRRLIMDAMPCCRAAVHAEDVITETGAGPRCPAVTNPEL